ATPAGHASAWTIMTNEQPFIHLALDKLGVGITTQALLKSFDGKRVTLSNIFTDKAHVVPAQSVVIVGLRLPSDELYQQLQVRSTEWEGAGIKSVERIGDALSAGALVHAVYSGHEFARNLDSTQNELYLRDIPIAEKAPGAVI
ncbi:MAG: hypothetical protein ACR2PZ_18800, partial [Pseudomonadales bacterium]